MHNQRPLIVFKMRIAKKWQISAQYLVDISKILMYVF